MQRLTQPERKNVVLIGAGHAHVTVLREFGLSPVAGTRLTVVSRGQHTPYSGMLPGLIAGDYRFEDIHINTIPLTRFAGALFHRDEAIGLDLGNRLVICRGGARISYDVLSIDIGAGANHRDAGAPLMRKRPRQERVEPAQESIDRLDRNCVLGRPRHIDSVRGGAELKALRAVSDWTPSIDDDAVAGYLRYGYIAQPRTIYREAAKLPPGHILVAHADGSPKLNCFWDLRSIAIAGQARNDPAPDPEEAVERLDALLRDAVRLRMIADVPLGAFLSGGIDSSTVVALMQAQSTRPVKTFSIGFHARGYDEAEHARQVAAHLGADHTEFYVEPRHALDVIPHLPEWYDEPFADASQIPTFLVSELTRRHVTVALSGDGGDELFAGYPRYLWTERLGHMLGAVPGMLHQPIANALRALSPPTWNRLLGWVPPRWRGPLSGDKLHKAATLFEHPEPDAIYRRLVSQWDKPDEIAARGGEPHGPLWDATLARDFPDLIPRLQYLDMVTYLPDDILAKVDRATMAVGLEGRVPLLDHRVVAYSWTLPLDFKLRHRQGKWLLRRVLDRYVPQRLIDRPKMGFGVPIDSWLRGPLRDWAESLLAPARLASLGLVRAEPVRRAWQEHCEGTRNWQYPLWTVLMLQAWRERWA